MELCAYPPLPPPERRNDVFSGPSNVCHVAYCIVVVQQTVGLLADCGHSRFLLNRRSNNSMKSACDTSVTFPAIRGWSEKVLGLTMKKQIYNFKIIFIFQHYLP